MVVLSLAFLFAPAIDLDNCCALTHATESQLLSSSSSVPNAPAGLPSNSSPDVSDHHCHHSFHYIFIPSLIKVSTVENLSYHVSLLSMGYFEQDFLRPPPPLS
jgi:hypothetical protein